MSGTAKTGHTLIRERNRKMILQAALRVFGEVGFGAASIRDIVRESGLSPGSFYNNFADKDAVLDGVIETFFTPLIGQLRLARQQAQTPEEFLRNTYDVIFHLALDNPAIAILIARNQTEFRYPFLPGSNRAQIVHDLAEDLSQWTVGGKFVAHDPLLMAETMVSLGLDLVVLSCYEPERAAQRLDFLVWMLGSTLAQE